MKRSLGFVPLVLLALGMIHASSSVLEAQDRSWNSTGQPTNGACFYMDADYRGDRFCVSAGESPQNVEGHHNDRISSIRIFGRAQVVVYEDANSGGASRTFTGDVPNLQDWNDRITTVSVQYSQTGGWRSGAEPQYGACFYTDADYRGEKFCATSGENQQNVGGRYNDKISSIRIYGGAEVTVYSDDNFRGASRTLRQDVSNLGDWNDRITSFRIIGGWISGYEPSNGACFYMDANYRGEKFCVASGQSQANIGERYNDKISSIRIYGGAEVNVYNNDNFDGASRTFREDVSNLGDWNDRITSFKITGGGYRGGTSGNEPFNGACFYLDSDYRGDSFCMNTGDSLRNVESRYNDRISSIRVFGKAIVTVFEDQNFGGSDKTYNRSVSNLGSFNDRITSIEVR